MRLTLDSHQNDWRLRKGEKSANERQTQAKLVHARQGKELRGETTSRIREKAAILAVGTKTSSNVVLYVFRRDRFA